MSRRSEDESTQVGSLFPIFESEAAVFRITLGSGMGVVRG